VQQMYAGS